MGFMHLFRADIRAAHGADLPRFEAWYYAQGIVEHRLIPFLTAAERRFLADLDPRAGALGEPVRRFDYLAFLAGREGPEGTEDRRALRAHMAGRTDAPAWLSILPRADRRDLAGVNVIGFADGVAGIGEDARMLAEALLDAGVPTAVFNVRYPSEAVTTAPSGLGGLETDRPLFPVNVFCLPPFETARLDVTIGPELFAGRRNIGYWPWELTSLPPQWRGAFDLVDEIWASSPFLTAIYRRLTDTPVRLMPPLVTAEPARVRREDFGFVAGDLVFLSMFDCNSFLARKNPLGAVEAFWRAFPNRNGRERLLLKSLNGHVEPQKLAPLEAAAAEDSRIVLIDGAMPRAEVAGLIAMASCFVSLHRAEGFGRVIAEAMLLGVPVIATDWSGSAALLDESTGFPVPAAMRPVRPEEYPFAEGSFWAEPDLDAAASAMRQIAEAPETARARARQAKARTENRHGRAAVSGRLIEAFGP